VACGIVLLEGTHDWTFHESTVLLSRDVAFVAVQCHLWGDDAKGTVWFDDLSLQLLDDPGVLGRKPLDLEKATVTVDFAKDLGAFRHLWIGSDVGHMDRVVTPTPVDAMRYAHRFGFRYLRMHNCVYNPRVYSEDAAGAPIFTWDTFDARVGVVVENGFRPVVMLEGMPTEIATRDGGRGWENPFPPKDDAGYGKWQRICEEMVTHCRQKWGDAIHDWYFEVWNEPDARGYFEGTLEEYLRIYDHAVAGATSADPDIRIGGPGGAGTGWLRAFLEHCASGRNDATGKPGCRTDFLSWHLYTVGVGIPCFDQLRLSLMEVGSLVREFPQYGALPTLITEWGCCSSANGVHDRPYDAAFRAMAVCEFMDAGITLALPFCLGEGPPHAHDGFQGGLALFTKTTLPKPSFRAFELLSRLIGQRVTCDSFNDPVGGLACLAENGGAAWVLLYNLVEDPSHVTYATEVTVQLAALPPGNWSCQATRIAPGDCDPSQAWEAMGRPESLTDEQRQTLLSASELPTPEPVRIERGAIKVRVPGFSVCLLELTRR